MITRAVCALVKAVTYLVTALTLTAVVLVGGCAVSNAVADFRYACSFWQPKLGVDEVLASKRWHTLLLDDWLACTYAVVRTDEASARRIAEQGPGAVPDLDQLDWQATPIRGARGERFVDSFECAAETDGLQEEVESALAAPGSWYVLELEAGYLLAPSARIAAKFRYGD